MWGNDSGHKISSTPRSGAVVLQNLATQVVDLRGVNQATFLALVNDGRVLVWDAEIYHEVLESFRFLDLRGVFVTQLVTNFFAACAISKDGAAVHVWGCGNAGGKTSEDATCLVWFYFLFQSQSEFLIKYVTFFSYNYHINYQISSIVVIIQFNSIQSTNQLFVLFTANTLTDHRLTG